MQKEILEVLESVNEYLPKLYNATEEIIMSFQTGRVADALKVMEHYIEGLSWLYEALESLATADASMMGILISYRDNSKLNEMASALTNQDYVLLCDLLQYEVKEEIEAYQKECTRVLENLKYKA